MSIPGDEFSDDPWVRAARYKQIEQQQEFEREQREREALRERERREQQEAERQRQAAQKRQQTRSKPQTESDPGGFFAVAALLGVGGTTLAQTNGNWVAAAIVGGVAAVIAYNMWKWIVGIAIAAVVVFIMSQAAKSQSCGKPTGVTCAVVQPAQVHTQTNFHHGSRAGRQESF